MASSSVALSICAITVPHALPAMPQSRPKTSTSSTTRLVTVDTASTMKGRVVSGRPYR